VSRDLYDLGVVIRKAAGLRLERPGHAALRAALARGWPGCAHGEVLRRALDPTTSRETIAMLIDEVTIKETSFLRDRRQLESIDWHKLSLSARAGGAHDVRVWSVACSTGEEPYSLALLACEAFASMTPPVTVLATDVSSAALVAAAAGLYGERSTAGVEEPLRSRYLEEAGPSLAVKAALRKLVSFESHNLVSGAYPPHGQSLFHLILCRNVLIYFDAATSARVVAGLERSLSPGGHLVLGAADALCVPALPEIRLRRPSAATGLVAGPFESEAIPGRPRGVLLSPAAAAPETSNAYYLRGLDELEAGDGAAAVTSLRRVLYLDPGDELAAFALGRAHESAGEPDAARRRYQQALRMLGARPEPRRLLAGTIDPATVVGACEARLATLADARRAGGEIAQAKDAAT
jgi:chemotaxis protein methyltransferase CheR